jgi:hypothetical protein
MRGEERDERFWERILKIKTDLRGEIEKRGLEINTNFLASFKEVQQDKRPIAQSPKPWSSKQLPNREKPDYT